MTQCITSCPACLSNEYIFCESLSFVHEVLGASETDKN